jgi:hypothetical protein
MASERPDQHLSASQISGAEDGEETLTPLEQEVLDEYARLLGNLNNVRPASLDGPHSLLTHSSYRCPPSYSTSATHPAPRY